MADLGAIGHNADIPNQVHRLLDVRPAIGPLTKTISGNIYDETNAGVARVVRVYLRRNGQYVGETTSAAGTGAYSMAVPDEEVQRIAIDADGGTLFNDLIDRVLPGS